MQRFLLLVLCLTATAAAVATDLPTTISSSTTLTLAASPYYLRASVVIAAGVSVTVEPGVQIIASGDHRLFVYGRMAGVGTAAAPIVFRAADTGARGAWQGLYVAPGGRVEMTQATFQNAACNIMSPGGTLRLTRCTLQLASGDGLFAWGAADIVCQGCTFGSNSGRGVYLEGYEATGSFNGCLFTGNTSHPVQMKATLVEMLQHDNRYVGNGVQRICVSCSMVEDITDTDVWVRQTVPYEAGGGGSDRVLTIAATGRLTVAPATVVYGMAVSCHGFFESQTDVRACSIFTAAPESLTPGSWEGFVFHPGSTGRFQGASILYATTGLTGDGASVTFMNGALENCRDDGMRFAGEGTIFAGGNIIRNNGRQGLRLDGESAGGNIHTTRFVGNGGHPVWAQPWDVRLLGRGNTYEANGVQAIGVNCSPTSDLPSGIHYWRAQTVPLDCAASGGGSVITVEQPAQLTIEGGQTLYLGGLEVYGRLTVAGCLARPCTFLPPGGSVVPGAWQGIRYAGGTGTVTGAIVHYAMTALDLTNSTVGVSECTLANSQLDGLLCAGTSAPVVTRTTIRHNRRYGVAITGTAAPNLGNLSTASTTDDGGNTIRYNSVYDVYNGSGNAIRAQNNVWSSTSPATIASCIFDRSDSAASGVVTYLPVLTRGTRVAPVLNWEGGTGYQADGVEPNATVPSTLLSFRVRYSDAEGDAPVSLRLHIVRGDNVPIPYSPFTMNLLVPGYTTGAVYGHDLYLPAGRDYKYWFSASDDALAATGPATQPTAGPVISTAPRLSFPPLGGYISDGVSPDAGGAGSTFVFRCIYQDADGDPPARLVCHVSRGGAAVGGSPFAMSAITSAMFIHGRTYEARVVLNQAGTYSYRFEADDGVFPATGPATATLAGPVVSGTAAAATGLAAIQIAPGLVETRWALSAPAHVDIFVCNMAGRVVAEVCRNRPFEAGSAAVVWPRRLATGAAVPAGRYLLMLEAAGSDGSRCRVTSPLWLR